MQFYNLIRCISFRVYHMYILHVLPFWSASSYFKNSTWTYLKSTDVKCSSGKYSFPIEFREYENPSEVS